MISGKTTAEAMIHYNVMIIANKDNYTEDEQADLGALMYGSDGNNPIEIKIWFKED